jgi:hypothetical protein
MRMGWERRCVKKVCDRVRMDCDVGSRDFVREIALADLKIGRYEPKSLRATPARGAPE